jgi:UDP-N-acetylmuramoyl-L-alanyl-D-glutamate--2,6-diaminopimelate ligase
MQFKKNISILVDYAHEPESMRSLLEHLTELKTKSEFDYLIHIVSCDGAGRDNWKKPILGDLSHKFADFTVVTLDNYDKNDNPEEILKLLTQNIDPASNHFQVNKSRSKAFDIALEIAKKQALDNKRVIICSTGVGFEKGLTQPEGIIDWNEKQVWQQKFEELKF